MFDDVIANQDYIHALSTFVKLDATLEMPNQASVVITTSLSELIFKSR